mmetsp:Transcript_82816/g.146335  ORF Transcript_82816/g.146335 Transcript_82816/m.146335 type:complete len:196 (+) Transcript_82816:50-637(+)|eukprot:CAMPEP_0197662104 /NCGR_PEP_ID=MMETSP1338-20131121/52130_1 /TAXON_ID=43686 ORGANISM="Pelagodinium beii, Strain RCC1491" /NCGR_SAMPLE_ID=MMETSP1338 /ASSEMBLY_ACC=CAM_ASM_000754 /LENGTH=195 /DNA_ID=CAMNT_0043239815 /DNA_START=46 /DNA_END=633 /DNA_ORIENTATION=-
MRCMSACFLAALLLAAADAQSLIGEFKQEVLGCVCKGGKSTHGNCGYHFHFGSDEDKPWCRTKYGCGFASLKGSWTHCDERGVEKRRADDGKLYNSKDFKKFYAKEGKDKWTKAEKYAEHRVARNGKAYTANQFRDYYIDFLGEEGWMTEWEKSKAETRKANDGSWYTFDEYVEFYGKDKAWGMWDSAPKLHPEL